MNKEQKLALAKDVLAHLGDITKEQYLEFCKICDELDLDPKDNEEVQESSWNDILDEFDEK